MHNLYEHDVDMILQSMHFLWISVATMTCPNIKNHWIKRLACTVLLDSFDTWPIMRVKTLVIITKAFFFIIWEGNYWPPAKQPVSSQNYRSSTDAYYIILFCSFQVITHQRHFMELCLVLQRLPAHRNEVVHSGRIFCSCSRTKNSNTHNNSCRQKKGGFCSKKACVYAPWRLHDYFLSNCYSSKIMSPWRLNKV